MSAATHHLDFTPRCDDCSTPAAWQTTTTKHCGCVTATLQCHKHWRLFQHDINTPLGPEYTYTCERCNMVLDVTTVAGTLKGHHLFKAQSSGPIAQVGTR